MKTTFSKTLSVFLFALFFAALLLWRGFFADLFWHAMSPVVAFRNTLDSYEISILRAELASTTSLIADREALYAENLQLKSQFGRFVGDKTVLATVLQRPPGIPYDTLLLNVGTQDGVASGDLVSAGGSTRIGTVRDVYERTSLVVLFSAPGDVQHVLLRGSIPLTLGGDGGGSLSGEVPAGTAVKVGDYLLSSEVASGFAGVVSYVETKDNLSFKIVHARLPANLFELRFVEILTRSN